MRAVSEIDSYVRSIIANAAWELLEMPGCAVTPELLMSRDANSIMALREACLEHLDRRKSRRQVETFPCGREIVTQL